RASPLDDPATPEPYTLSLHDALPISIPRPSARWPAAAWPGWEAPRRGDAGGRAGCATGCSWALLVSVVVGGCPGVGWAGRRGWAGLPERCGPSAARQLLGILRAPHRRGAGGGPGAAGAGHT